MHPIEKLIAEGWQRHRLHDAHPDAKQARKGKFVVSFAPVDDEPRWALVAPTCGTLSAFLAMANTFNGLLREPVGCVTVGELIGVKPRQTFCEWAAMVGPEQTRLNHTDRIPITCADIDEAFPHAKPAGPEVWDVDGWKIAACVDGQWECSRRIVATGNSPAAALAAAKRAAHLHGVGAP